MQSLAPMASPNAVALRATSSLRGAPLAPGRRCASRVVVRSDVKQGRTYREDGGKDGQGAIFADEVEAQRAKAPQKSNLSPEMKKRLKEEYVGLGGTANKVPFLPRRPLVFASTLIPAPPSTTAARPSAPNPVSAPPSTLADRARIEHTRTAHTSTSAPVVPPAKVAGSTAVRSSKWTIDPNELLVSTWEHRLWTWGSAGIMGAVLYRAVSQVQEPQEMVAVVTSILAAYVLSDLGTGVYHWSVDNYGDGSTPLVGRQIAAFQGHHQKPWTITKREFCNNVHQVFKPACVPGVLLLGLSLVAPCWWNSFASVFLFLICMSQQFHAWSHMKKSQLPAVVLTLQDAGLLISRKAHGAHHRAPFEGNYCIVSGLWNDALDQSGFFRALETYIADATGVEPRCWHAPEYEYEELEAATMES